MQENKKGGRPKKTESEKAKHRVSAYLTDAQLAQTYQRMGLFGYQKTRKNVARFFTEMALIFISREDLMNNLRQERLDDIYNEFFRIGNNINQLTKAINSGTESINQEGINVLLELKESIVDLRRSVQ